MTLEARLNQVVDRYESIGEKLAISNLGNEERVDLSKEYSDLMPVVDAITKLRSIQSEIESLEGIVSDEQGETEISLLAEEELLELKKIFVNLEDKIKVLLLPRDEADQKNAMLEIRAGTGGDEAALFAGDLSRMYQRYAESHGWKFELVSVSDTGLGGIKETVLSINGKGVFARLKFESGVHRVQRVPETEASGRIHTSAATVAVLPEAEDVDIQIDDKDLRIDVYRASGPGGQSVNTTDSAVRITHVPTSIVVTQQDEKSQHKNKAKALKVLRARLYERQRQESEAERAADRKDQVGSGDRSERIRTYNFPQGRVTDHRINLTIYKLEKVLAGEALDELIDALVTEDNARRLVDSD
tara:strand:- start:7467 stop:8540 length:1074 start_codon:yes stop_codon:yes gene_type:complete